ncbi:hypothetical protein KR018_008966, partial [Drosophila ironensis]
CLPHFSLIPPPVSWAQRNDLIYVIIDVECKDIEQKVTEKTFTFKGVNVLDASKKYDVTLNFLHEVDPEKVTSKNIGRCMEFTIPKKEAGPYWASLTTDKTKLHFLKANFAKWRDESDDEDGDGKDDGMFNNLVSPGSNWNNKFSDFNVDDEEEEDSDDNIPSLSQNDEEEEEGGEGDKEKKVAA